MIARCSAACILADPTAGPLAPLLLSGADELVEYGLRAVGEVAELRLPAHKRLRPRHRVAILEPHRGELRQQGVVDVKLGRALIELLERCVLPAGVAVHEHHMPLAEG